MRAVLAFVLMVTGCSSLQTPWDQVDLIPSSWTIVSATGEPILDVPPPTLTIGQNSEARLQLRCGAIDLEFLSDTDGSGLTFDERASDPACAQASPLDAAIRVAVASVEGWRASSDSAIEFLDGNEQPLLALRKAT